MIKIILKIILVIFIEYELSMSGTLKHYTFKSVIK